MRSCLKALNKGYMNHEFVLGETSGEAARGSITAQTHKIDIL